MGYTHYWRRPQAISNDIFRSIRFDFEKLLLPLSEFGVVLAGWDGREQPDITNNLIRFNGLENCCHPQNEELVIPYPSEFAQGLGPSSTAIDGDFYGVGVTVRHRCCGGRCSCETFVFERGIPSTSYKRPNEQGLFGGSTKTAFRAFDVAVTAALIIAKRHLRERLIIHSNGRDAQWTDARRICQQVLGYGEWFGIIEEQMVEHWPEERVVSVRTLVEIAPPRA